MNLLFKGIANYAALDHLSGMRRKKFRMKKRGLVWFKNDLRLHDNEALVKAQQECSDLVCCYCIEKSDFEKLDLGFRRKDAVRFKFMHQSVLDLRKNLESLGGHLIVGEISAVDTLVQLVEKYGVTDVYAEQEYAAYELDLVNAVINALPAVKFHFFWGKTLYHKDDIPFKISNIPPSTNGFEFLYSSSLNP